MVKTRKKKKKMPFERKKLSLKHKKAPVIGMFTIPLPRESKAHAHSYLPSSTVKWIEMSAARVMPIMYDLPHNVMKTLLEQCNGLVIWGTQINALFHTGKHETAVSSKIGPARYKTYIRALDFAFSYILSENIKGNFYPILGVSDGAQKLALAATFAMKRDKEILRYKKVFTSSEKYLSHIAARNYPQSLRFTKNKSIFKSAFTTAERKKLSKEKVLYVNSSLGIKTDAKYIQKYVKPTKMSPTEMVIDAEGIGRNGAKFVTIFSFKNLPLYGFQFLPQTIQFEHQVMNHIQTKEARLVSNKLSKTFVNLCKKNMNNLLDPSLLIYSYTLYGRKDIPKILHPKAWFYKFFNTNYESAYFFNLVPY